MPRHQLCRNCGHIVEENYCPSCGQRTTTHRLNWAALAESFTATFIGDEAYGLHGIHMRKGAVSTWFDIIFRPQRVIPEFIEGHRRKYFNPVSILLLLSTFYTVVFLLIDKEFTPSAADGQPPLQWLWNTYIDYATLHPAGFLLVRLPISALAMKTVFRHKTDLRYVEYLYIGIFISIFMITLKIVALPTELLLPKYNSLYMNILPQLLYTAFVFWKIFGLKKKGAVLRTLLTELLKSVYLLLIASVGAVCVMIGYYFLSPENFEKEFSYFLQTDTEEAVNTEGGEVRKFFDGVLDAPGEEDEVRQQALRQPADSLRAH